MQKNYFQLIKNRIEVGTTIVSNGCLINEDYNRAYNFIDHNRGAHTNNIEREWCDIRNMVQTISRKVGYGKHFN